MAWAKKLRARAVLIHSLRDGLHPVIQTAYGAGAQSHELEGVIAPYRDKALRTLEQKKKLWERAGVACQVFLDQSFGLARDAVLERAQAVDASLIFLGTHGRNLALKAFLGSTAREVLLLSTVPVVTVRS